MTVGWISRRFSLGRLIEFGLLCILAAALIVVAADWVIWKSRGAPRGSVVVTRVVVAPLKGNREEYYPDGTETLRCSQSILPWAETQACWWLDRRRVVLER